MVGISTQLKTRAVAAKTTTMVEPIHLLLFGCSSVVSHGNNIIKMDEWLESQSSLLSRAKDLYDLLCRIPLVMSHDSAALIGGLRQAIDDMIVRLATDPTLATDPPPYDSAIIQAVFALVSSKATPPNIPNLPPGGCVDPLN